jgi:hypothetical protein
MPGWIRVNHQDFPPSKPKKLSADGKWYETVATVPNKAPARPRQVRPRPRQPSPPRPRAPKTVRSLLTMKLREESSSESEEEAPPPPKPKKKKSPVKKQPSLKKQPTPPPSRTPSRQPSFTLMPWDRDPSTLPELSQQPPPEYPAYLRRQVKKH